MSEAALARVLDAVEEESPVAVARGRAALGRALGWMRRTSWPEAAWTFSGLASGTPVELVWRPGRPGLFWTAEPAAPELARARRFHRGLAVLRANGSGLRADARRLARHAFAATRVEWPVFVAGRHDGGGDSGKIYLHAPTLPAGFADLAGYLRPGDRMMMTGLASTGLREVYWERHCDPGDLWQMKQRPGLGPMAEALEAELHRWTGHGLDHERKLGLSLSAGPDGGPLALAVFLHLRQAGGEKAVRRRLLEEGGEANPALASAWEAGLLRPMLLTLGVTATGAQAALGLRFPVPI